MALKRKKATDRQRIQTPHPRRLVLATFGPEGSNGWDLWVPEHTAVTSVKRQGGGTLIRLTPDAAR